VTFSRYNKKRFALKTNTLKYFICSGLLVFLIACSTKKNTFLSRNSHALSTKYNILYNGGIALDKGIQDVVLQNKDNFWERLPVERMQIADEQMMPGDTKNQSHQSHSKAFHEYPGFGKKSANGRSPLNAGQSALLRPTFCSCFGSLQLCIV
jgi:hypothetical protein